MKDSVSFIIKIPVSSHDGRYNVRVYFSLTLGSVKA